MDKIYTHKSYIFYDEKGRQCKLRCAFDKDRFFLRSFSFVEDDKVHRPKLMEHSIVGSFEYKELIMSQIKIVKYTYKASNTFEVRDEYGAACWIRFEQAGPGEDTTDAGQMQNQFQPIPIEQGY